MRDLERKIERRFRGPVLRVHRHCEHINIHPFFTRLSIGSQNFARPYKKFAAPVTRIAIPSRAQLAEPPRTKALLGTSSFVTCARDFLWVAVMGNSAGQKTQGLS